VQHRCLISKLSTSVGGCICQYCVEANFVFGVGDRPVTAETPNTELEKEQKKDDLISCLASKATAVTSIEGLAYDVRSRSANECDRCI